MKKELLVPVGNKDCLIAAINNGADAVYLAGKKFGARAFANNFALEELEEIIKLCHLYSVKVYVTVNTLIYEDEIDDAVDFLTKIHEYGVDAVIMQDIGLIDLIHHKLPNLEIHASTQMHNFSNNIKFLEELGIKRVVFAREMDIDYIDSINTSLEKEAFIHGSLCVCYSGQCYFSKEILDRSANRGECAGMCRLKYDILENDNLINTDGNYLLSPKDLSTYNDFKRIMESSIDSLKIEGRMKSPLYVGIVTKIYRKLIDNYYNNRELVVDKEDIDLLKASFYREYTGGFILKDNNFMNIKSSNHIGLYIGKVIEVNSKKIKIKLDNNIKQGDGIRFKESDIGINVNFIYDKDDKLINSGKKYDIIYLDNFMKLKSCDNVYLTNPNIKIENNIIKKIPINIKYIAKLGKIDKLIVSDNINEVILEGNIINKAINSPINKEDINKCLSKLGNTPFYIDNMEIIMDSDIFIRIGDINNLRRNAINELILLRENAKKEVVINNNKYEELGCNSLNNGLYVLARTKEQIKALKELDVNIIVDKKEYMEDGFYYKIPRNGLISNYNYSKYLVTSYASMNKCFSNISDVYLNVTNHYTANVLSKFNNIITLSMENDIDNIKNIVSNYKSNNLVVYLYGNIELMIMKSCLLKNIFGNNKCNFCINNNNNYYLKDRNNQNYRILTDSVNHTSYILNYKKTNLISYLSLFKELGINNYRIDLLDEDYEEVIELINKIKNNM